MIFGSLKKLFGGSSPLTPQQQKERQTVLKASIKELLPNLKKNVFLKKYYDHEFDEFYKFVVSYKYKITDSVEDMIEGYNNFISGDQDDMHLASIMFDEPNEKKAKNAYDIMSKFITNLNLKITSKYPNYLLYLGHEIDDDSYSYYLFLKDREKSKENKNNALILLYPYGW